MSEAKTGNGSATTTEAMTLPEDVLSRIVTETERAFSARAARPSPIHLTSWEQIERFAEKAARSGMVPKDYVNKPDAIAIAVQMGSELGLAPMQALSNIAVINGRPAVWGDAMLGLVRSSGLCREVRESFTGEGETLTAVCVAARRDQATPVIQSFSVAQAKKAGLWGRGVWASYSERMLQMRARGFALRDAFPDVLRGLISAEEARDIPWEDTGLPPVATAQPITPPQPQSTRTATQVVDEIEAQAKAATSPEDLQQLERDDLVRKIREHLPVGRPQRDRMEALLIGEGERVSAFWEAPKAPDDDTEDHIPDDMKPADADATRASKVEAAIAVASSLEVIDKAILGNKSNSDWIAGITPTRPDIITRLERARQARIDALGSAAP